MRRQILASPRQIGQHLEFFRQYDCVGKPFYLKGIRMSTTPLAQSIDHIADKATESAEHGLMATQHAANGALNMLADKVLEIRNQAAPMLENTNDLAKDYLHQGMNSVRNASHQLTDAAANARNGAAGYIKEEPVKALLIAAATGAALMALVSLISHSHRKN